MRGTVAVLIGLVLFTACGRGSDVTGPTIVATPTPVPFPVLRGGWIGTWTQVSVGVGTPGSGTATCNETWVITSQSGGAFSGSFQKSAGTTNTCNESGRIDGFVTTAGAVTIQFDTERSNSPISCTVLSGTREYRGVLSPNGSISAVQNLRLRCSTGGVTVVLDRTATITMRRS